MMQKNHIVFGASLALLSILLVFATEVRAVPFVDCTDTPGCIASLVIGGACPVCKDYQFPSDPNMNCEDVYGTGDCAAECFPDPGASCAYNCPDDSCPRTDPLWHRGEPAFTDYVFDNQMVGSTCTVSGVCSINACGPQTDVCNADNASRCVSHIGLCGGVTCHAGAWGGADYGWVSTSLLQTSTEDFWDDYVGDACSDGFDNDCDGKPDCQDSDCADHVDCTLPASPMLKFRHGTDNVRGAIGYNGAFHIEGQLFDNQGSITEPGTGSFVLRNNAGTPILLLTTTGDLFLTGTVHPNQANLNSVLTDGTKQMVLVYQSNVVAYFAPTGDVYLTDDFVETQDLSDLPGS